MIVKIRISQAMFAYQTPVKMCLLIHELFNPLRKGEHPLLIDEKAKILIGEVTCTWSPH